LRDSVGVKIIFEVDFFLYTLILSGSANGAGVIGKDILLFFLLLSIPLNYTILIDFFAFSSGC